MKNWPRLSQTLMQTTTLLVCQKCGVDKVAALTRWQEHDENDKPEPIVIILCKKCAGEIIGPHVRLYRELAKWEPFPGAMGICELCEFRKGHRCESPLCQFNGGTGLDYEPSPQKATMAHFYGGARRSGWLRIYSGPVTRCSGFKNTTGATGLSTLVA